MLNKKSIALAKTVVSNEGLFLFPRTGSLLFSPVAESLPFFQSHKPSLEAYDQVLFDNSQRTIGMVEPHEGAVAGAVEVVGGALLRQIGYVRNTVVPLITDVTGKILDKMKGVEPKEFTVTQYDPAPIIYDPYVVDTFAQFKPSAPLFVRIKNGPEKTDVDLIDGMKTGVSELDDALADVIAKYGADTVVSIYNVLFRNCAITPICPVTRFVSELVQQKDGQRCEGKFTDASLTDLGIVVYFLVDSMSQDPLPGTGMTLPEYEAAINAMKLQYGYLIKNGLGWLSSCSRRGQMIIRFTGKSQVATSAEDAEIVVFGPVYRQGLSQGLTPESVIGGVLDPRGGQRLLGQFIANDQQNLKRWQALEIQRQRYSHDTFLKRLSNCIVPELAQALNGLNEDQLPMGFSKEAALNRVMEDLKSGKFYANWNIDNDPNLFELIKQKACKHIFTFIDAEDIIDIVESEMQDSDQDGTTAAYTAAIRYLAKWLVANFDVLTFKQAEKVGIIEPDDVTAY